MPRVMSASRRLRKMGAAPVLGLTRAKSAAVSSSVRSGSVSSSSRLCRKKAQRVCAKARSGPPNSSTQNLKLACTSGKNTLRFSKSNKTPSRPVSLKDRKKGAAPLSAAMPLGVTKATSPSGAARVCARSTNRLYRLTSPPPSSG